MVSSIIIEIDQNHNFLLVHVVAAIKKWLQICLYLLN